ncbi:MAG: putative toxin-antitoxin system toxin component, PIN family [Lewinellaceae bacterium]|nr:putative toxin-antitoxin system toxin component, PIN family [Lewinellaceae bacterium]
MKVVLDTNVLLAALPRTSESHAIFLELVSGSYEICLTSDILNEYEEVFQRKTNAEIAALVLDVLEILPNLLRINKYYYWQLITADPDDNKFVDCAVAANADFIVTNDKHFRVLKDINFPKVNVISGLEFLNLLKKS